MFVGNYDGLQKGYKICQLSRKIASKSIPFSTISGGIKRLITPKKPLRFGCIQLKDCFKNYNS